MNELDRMLNELRSDVLLKVCRHDALRVSESQAMVTVQDCMSLESALRTVETQQTLLDRTLRRLILVTRFRR